MSLIRRFILALTLSAGIFPAFAQAPPPVPALPDTERRTTYSISGTTCACAVNFALYGDSTDYANWIEVFINGVQQVGNWTITSPTGSISTIPRPITDAVLTFTAAQTGTVQIVGARRPRRTSQFTENQGVSARSLNQVFTDIIATQRETWDKTTDVSGRAVLVPPGETLALLPVLASRANMGACFDGLGNLTTCVSVPSSTFTSQSPIVFTGTGPTTVSCPTCVAGYNGLFGNVTAFSADKRYYVSTSGSDGNNGLSPESAKLTLQAAVNAASGGGVVYAGAGTFTLAATLAMQPGVSLQCQTGTTITQANSANLLTLVDFAANSAHGASIKGCTIDGNRANNAIANGGQLVNIATANDVTLESNTIRNGVQQGITVTFGLRPRIISNTISNNFYSGVYVIPRSPETVTDGDIAGNHFKQVGAHAITLDGSDFNRVRHNDITGVLITGLTINTLGTTVTVTGGGTPFSNTCSATTICPGNFLVAAGGGAAFQEIFILSITSSTVATASATALTSTGAAAIGGSGDLIDVAALASNNVVSNNILQNGTAGIVDADVGDSANSGSHNFNTYYNNYIQNMGGACFAITQSLGANFLGYISAVGNRLAQCVFGGVAIYQAAINPIGAMYVAGAQVSNISIDAHWTADVQVSPTTPYWLALSGAATGSVSIGSHTEYRMVNAGISGAISSITLGAGWGNTATTSAIVSSGNAFKFTITASGTGQAASASIAVNTSAKGNSSPPQAQCKNINSSVTVLGLYGENNSTDGVINAFSVTAPTAGQTYVVSCLLM